ncbi:MAG: acyclic terpene utilization AtuA family protein [Betaproteobacteria bacterium]
MSKVYIGCGAGFAGDRFDAAVPIVRALADVTGERFLIYEVLAERTLAIAQRLKRENPDQGYSPFLDTYLPGVLADCHRHGIRIVTNMGAANPIGAARRVHVLAGELGIRGLKVAAVTGDDLLLSMAEAEIRREPVIEGITLDGRAIVAANAYLGARPVADALATGAHVVLVGRTTDAALSLGPLMHVHGWKSEDLDRLAQGNVCGHLPRARTRWRARNSRHRWCVRAVVPSASANRCAWKCSAPKRYSTATAGAVARVLFKAGAVNIACAQPCAVQSARWRSRCRTKC